MELSYFFFECEDQCLTAKQVHYFQMVSPFDWPNADPNSFIPTYLDIQ